MKSPLKEKPLRNPGESLDKEIRGYAMDHVFAYLFVPGFLGALALFEWYSWYFSLPPQPWLLTAVFLISIPFVAWKVRKAIKHLKHLKQGRDGEKFVGQYLNSLSIPGIRVFHDVPGKDFNLDHVVISPSGVFVIETKAPSKPLKGQTIVTFDGSAIDVNGFRTDAPLIQVRAAAGWLKDLLKSGTGKDFVIQPVVVYPDWYVQEKVARRNGAIRVVHQEFLPGMLSSNHLVLEEHEVAMAADHLARYVRSSQEK